MPEVARQAVENLSRAPAIAAELMCFTDFPTENYAEALDTLRFIDELREHIATFIVGTFEPDPWLCGRARSRAVWFGRDLERGRRCPGDHALLSRAQELQERSPTGKAGTGAGRGGFKAGRCAAIPGRALSLPRILCSITIALEQACSGSRSPCPQLCHRPRVRDFPWPSWRVPRSTRPRSGTS